LASLLEQPAPAPAVAIRNARHRRAWTHRLGGLLALSNEHQHLMLVPLEAF
jgi:hypothetical protein